jgi:hypothetical protein
MGYAQGDSKIKEIIFLSEQPDPWQPSGRLGVRCQQGVEFKGMAGSSNTIVDPLDTLMKDEDVISGKAILILEEWKRENRFDLN